MKTEPIRRYQTKMPNLKYAEDGGFVEMFRTAQVLAVEHEEMNADNEIYRACIAAAIEAGITDLYLVDKQFVADAIREKLEREQERTELQCPINKAPCSECMPGSPCRRHAPIHAAD